MVVMFGVLVVPLHRSKMVRIIAAVDVNNVPWNLAVCAASAFGSWPLPRSSA